MDTCLYCIFGDEYHSVGVLGPGSAVQQPGANEGSSSLVGPALSFSVVYPDTAPNVNEGEEVSTRCVSNSGGGV